MSHHENPGELGGSTASLLVAASGVAHSDVRFPEGFQWCVATAAHQIEGGNSNSDWWDWEQIPGNIANGEKSGRACDSWNRVSEDVAMLKHLGVGTYRFSVEWARIEPEQGHYDPAAIAHYRKEVMLLRKAGIAPIITLQHFTMPRWLREKGGWEWEGTEEAFTRFAALVYSKIAPGVRDWVTINEPMVNVMGGYFEGVVPPGEHRNLEGIVPVIRGLLKAHADAYLVLHMLAKTQGMPIRVGMAHHLRTFDPFILLNPLDVIASQIAQQEWNWMIPDALESGRLQMHVPFVVDEDEVIPALAGSQDFLGVNYYTGDLISFSSSRGIIQHVRDALAKTDLGWDIYPDGFYRILHEVADRYPGKPIFVTENGVADARDAERPEFLRDHLKAMAQAIDEGVPVEGYCHWSLMDNFEWVSGFEPRFGLYETDYRTFKRTPRPSAELFRQIVKNNGFNEDELNSEIEASR